MNIKKGSQLENHSESKPRIVFKKRKRNKKVEKVDEKWGIDFYEKHYEIEISTRDKILGRFNTSIGLFIPVTGGILFMLRSYVHHKLTAEIFLFWQLYGLCSLAMIVAVILLTKTWWFNKYIFIPTAEELRQYHDDVLIPHYSSYPNKDELVSEAFSKYLLKLYCDNATCNAKTNIKRAKCLFYGNGFLILAAILAIVSYIIFCCFSLDKNETIDVKQSPSIISTEKYFLKKDNRDCVSFTANTSMEGCILNEQQKK